MPGPPGGKPPGSSDEALTWDDVYAILALNTGWPLPVIDRLRWPEVQALLRQWRHAPPPHISLARLTGYKPPDDPAARTAPTLKKADIMAMFGGSAGGKDFKVTRWADDPVIRAAFAPPD